MIHKVEMFGATCDGCKEEWTDGEYSCWNEEGFLEDCLVDSDWHITDDGKTYCPNCHRFDDDGKLILTLKNENTTVQTPCHSSFPPHSLGQGSDRKKNINIHGLGCG